jgi:hypothetical protein
MSYYRTVFLRSLYRWPVIDRLWAGTKVQSLHRCAPAPPPLLTPVLEVQSLHLTPDSAEIRGQSAVTAPLRPCPPPPLASVLEVQSLHLWIRLIQRCRETSGQCQDEKLQAPDWPRQLPCGHMHFPPSCPNGRFAPALPLYGNLPALHGGPPPRKCLAKAPWELHVSCPHQPNGIALRCHGPTSLPLLGVRRQIAEQGP